MEDFEKYIAKSNDVSNINVIRHKFKGIFE